MAYLHYSNVRIAGIAAGVPKRVKNMHQRIAKSKIEVRPMFHFTRKRIEAHICLRFVALKVYKELDRILKLDNINMSVDKVLRMAKTITTLQIRLPLNNEVISKVMIMKRHKAIERLFDENFWVTQ